MTDIKQQRSNARRFISKTVMVIGGNSGIGFVAAKSFATEGARVLITGRDAETLNSAVRELGAGALAHRTDIADLHQIDALFDYARSVFDRIDILFVNAGISIFLPIERVTESDWNSVQNVNVRGAFFCVQAALPAMRSGSAIVLNGSIAGLRGEPAGALYATSKAALSSLGRCLAAELVQRGIRVNTVVPGPTDTPLLDRIGGVSSDRALEMKCEMTDMIPMRRLGTSQEVAAAVLFLASSESSFITGSDLIVDGGTANFW